MKDRREWHHAMLERMSREDPIGYLNMVQQWGGTPHSSGSVLEGEYRVVRPASRAAALTATNRKLKEVVAAIREGNAK